MYRLDLDRFLKLNQKSDPIQLKIYFFNFLIHSIFSLLSFWFFISFFNPYHIRSVYEYPTYFTYGVFVLDDWIHLILF